MNHSKFYLFASIFFFCLSGCQRELSFSSSNNPGIPVDSAAVFALIPAGSNCSDAIVSGIFEVGKALNTDAKITVTVSVSKTGVWSYSTNSINGFTFTGSGRFTSTGSQTITLQGSGTPAAVGSFSVPLNINNANCSSLVTVTPANSSSTAVYYYTATIGGTNFSQTVTATNGYEASFGAAGLDHFSFDAAITYINPPKPAGLTEFGVSKGLLYNYFPSTVAKFKAFFAPGNYPYSSNHLAADGVQVIWIDPAGDSWATHSGIRDQTGSTFKIVSISDTYDSTGRYFVTAKMEFNCKLYHSLNGAMKQLTKGEMVGRFIKF